MTDIETQESWQTRLFARYYYERAGWRNGTWQFYDHCREYIAQSARPLILEIGCGLTNATTQFLAGLGTVYGADIDPNAASNKFIEQFRLIDSSNLEYPKKSFDACVSSWAVEHVGDPGAHLATVYSVLKPGAPYIFMTPNLFHYVSLVSHLSPQGFHKLVANRLRALPVSAHDPYPTFYRMNTDRNIRRYATRAGFEVEMIRRLETEPSYGRYSIGLFYLFLAYERTVNKWEFLSCFRHTRIVVLRRPSGSA